MAPACATRADGAEGRLRVAAATGVGVSGFERAEALLQALNLPYRTVILCGGDVGFTAKGGWGGRDFSWISQVLARRFREAAGAAWSEAGTKIAGGVFPLGCWIDGQCEMLVRRVGRDDGRVGTEG